MLRIDTSDLIGKGLHRECYRHPEDDNLCVKIVVHGNGEESEREKKYYRHLSARGISWDSIPRFYGDIETNLGMGSVFDLILDNNGEVSKTLEYYLSSTEASETHCEGLTEALYSLKGYLLQHRVITMTLQPKNIVCKKLESGQFRLFLVDNIGNSDFIPICNYSEFFAKKKILRKWQHFEASMLKNYPRNTALRQMLAGSRR